MSSVFDRLDFSTVTEQEEENLDKPMSVKRIERAVTQMRSDEIGRFPSEALTKQVSFKHLSTTGAVISVLLNKVCLIKTYSGCNIRSRVLHLIRS